MSEAGIYQDFNTGLFDVRQELIAHGTYYDSFTLNVTAAIEFDLRDVNPGRHTLELFHTGGTLGFATANSFELFEYIGNGIVTPEDRHNVDNSLGTLVTLREQLPPLSPPQYFRTLFFAESPIYPLLQKFVRKGLTQQLSATRTVIPLTFF